MNPRCNVFHMIKLGDSIGDAAGGPVEEPTGRSFTRLVGHGCELFAAGEQLWFRSCKYHADINIVIVMCIYLDSGEPLYTLV